VTVVDERAELLAGIAGQTLTSWLSRNAEEHPGSPALTWRDGESWRTLSWGGYRDRVEEVGAALVATGVEHGSRIAIMAGNRIEHVICDLAAVGVGAVPVSVYPTMSVEQVAYVAADAGVTLAVLADDVIDRWRAVRDASSGLRIVALGDGAEGTVGWQEFVSAGSSALTGDPAIVARRAARTDPSDPATVIYTSGTTGVPKGVVLSQANVAFLVAAFQRVIEFPPGFVNISYLPLAHIAERLFSHYIGLSRHGHTWFCPDPAGLPEVLLASRPHAFLGVPRVWEKLRAAAEHGLAATGADPAPAAVAEVRARLGLDRCVVCLSGAAPMRLDVLEFWSRLGLLVQQVYGMTETTGVATVHRPGDGTFGHVGPALPGVELRLLEGGEVTVRGPGVMTGYLGRPEDTAAVVDRDGWLRTGDLGALDDAGRLRIVGRAKEIIVTSGGKNIAPVPIEAKIAEHPLVGQVCLVGDDRPYLVALVVLDPAALAPWAQAHGVELTDVQEAVADARVRAAVQGAIDAANGGLSRPEQVRRFALLGREWTADSGELTPSLKLRRAVVREKYAERIDELYR